MKNIFLCTALATILAACAPASLTPGIPITPPAAPSTTVTYTANTPTLVATETPVIPAETPTPTVSPAQTCDELTLNGKPGLYVVSLQPIPDLVWDRTPRQFLVDICSTLPGATPIGSRFVALVYYLGDPRPRGQTSELPIQLDPGLHEITLESWIPGLQNHVSACNLQPLIQVSVAYTFPPSVNIVHPIPFADGQDKRTFAVKCGGNFP